MIFREGKGGRKTGRETSMWRRNTDQLPLICTSTRDWTQGPDICRDGELNWQVFTLQGGAQTTEPHWSRHPKLLTLKYFSIFWYIKPDYLFQYLCWLLRTQFRKYSSEKYEHKFAIQLYNIINRAFTALILFECKCLYM